MNDRIPRPKPGLRTDDVESDMLIYDMVDTRAVYLNDVAALVWRLCDGERTVGEMVALLVEAYPEAADRIEPEVHETIRSLKDLGVLELA